jgi:1-deoxy-D-xylulose-5-phosphate reductoisomerase
MRPKNIAILGSTGSIGRNSLEVIANSPELFRVVSLSANKNIDGLQSQIDRFRPTSVAVLDPVRASELKKWINSTVRLYSGEDGLLALIDQEDIDIVISSFVGFAGLRPTIRAVEAGKTIALANKETLVVAGGLIMDAAQRTGARIVPVDSEHSAILQCLAGEESKNVARIILTASGGPFLGLEAHEFDEITVEAALKHPNWNMGKKITIDSATLMNKGLEVIEAHWLFGLPPKSIEVIIHPQSVIHSMVEFVDGSIKAQLGIPDMKIPIQYALTYPSRFASIFPRIDFSEVREMTFSTPDVGKFPCLTLAYEVLEEGGTAPAVMNAANEVAVQKFLQKEIRFTDIHRLIRETLDRIPTIPNPDLGQIVEADRSARELVGTMGRQLNYV